MNKEQQILNILNILNKKKPTKRQMKRICRNVKLADLEMLNVCKGKQKYEFFFKTMIKDYIY